MRCKGFLKDTQEALRTTIQLEKVKLDFIVKQRLDEFKRNAERECRQSVERILIGGLRSVLGGEQLGHLEKVLSAPPAWQEQSEGVEWNLSSLNLNALQEGAIQVIEETGEKEKPYLVPAKYRTVTKKVWGRSGIGLPMGAIEPSLGGPTGGLIGMGLGVLGGLFGGSSKTQSVTYQEVEQEAKFEWQKVSEQVKKYAINVDKVVGEVTQIGSDAVGSFLNWYEQTLAQGNSFICTTPIFRFNALYLH